MNRLLLIWSLLFASVGTSAFALPQGFVYLHEVAPLIQYDLRYTSYHNFIGRPVKGYEKPICILTKPAALALAKVQQELLQSGLTLHVYDCYRPQRAVNDFIQWSKIGKIREMKQEFYPDVTKDKLFRLGYVAKRSGHSRGSTIDLTIAPIVGPKPDTYRPGDKLTPCYNPYRERFYDGSVDMGTGYDCMDTKSHSTNKTIPLIAYHNRMLLQQLMLKYGFRPYSKEWWHFTLKKEPHPSTYFDFPMQ